MEISKKPFTLREDKNHESTLNKSEILLHKTIANQQKKKIFEKF